RPAHGRGGGVPTKLVLQLPKTVLTGAVIENLVLVRLDRRAAYRAFGREMEDLLLPGAHAFFRPDNVGDDLTRLDDDDHVADADILGADVVGIMETGTAHSGAGQSHRFELGGGR